MLTDEVAIAALVVIGVLQLALHPIRTYRWAVHGEDWNRNR